MLNGVRWSCVVALVPVVWFENFDIGMIIGLAMIINLVIASIAVALIPISLKRLCYSWSSITDNSNRRDWFYDLSGGWRPCS